MQVNWLRAVGAGIVGTAIMTGVGVWVAPLMGMPPTRRLVDVRREEHAMGLGALVACRRPWPESPAAVVVGADPLPQVASIGVGLLPSRG